MVAQPALLDIERRVQELCLRYAEQLPFHGWHHVRFVRDKAVDFAEQNGANVSVVTAAALLHDVNYLVRKNSPAAAGTDLRLGVLAEVGVPAETADWIDRIIGEAEMRNRHRDISLEAQALSDADTLYKALPITPVLLAHRYLEENGVSLPELAQKILSEQQGVQEAGYYFYNAEAAARYTQWARANLRLWQCIAESLDDPSVLELVAALEPVAEGAAAG
ncbi:HD family phosphohydrolase [Tamaricihabitans halophyticus]|nr:HD family phosphohydrolase [Tamaricihabitans halophyticus]